jgi:uncharacterized membrane protein YphA (DoxX/SURF4 family)
MMSSRPPTSLAPATPWLSADAPWLSTAARVLLAAVFAAAGWPKLLDPEGTVRSVRAFRILPEELVRPFAYGLPVVELGLAVLLLVGLGTRLAGAAIAALLLVFVAGIAAAWARGLAIECGCFGGGGATVADPVPGHVRDLLRDLLLLGAAGLLVLRPRSRWSLDGALGRHPEPTDPPSARRPGAPDVRRTR